MYAFLLSIGDSSQCCVFFFNGFSENAKPFFFFQLNMSNKII